MTVLQMGPLPPPHGGVQSNLIAIRSFLQKNGIRSGLMSLTRHQDARGEEIYHPRGAFQVAWLLLRLPYSILHLHVGGEFTPRLLFLALFLSFLPGRKSVLSFHSGGYPSSPHGRAARPGTFRGFVLRRFDRVIAVNEQIADVMRRYGVRPDLLRCISPAALDPAEIAPALPPLLAQFFLAHHPVLLSVGLLEPEYDLPIQIQVIGEVLREFPDCGFVIIGSGSLEADLRAAIRAQPWADRILLAGDVAHDQTLAAILRAEVLLRTTLYDGDALSVREALQLGTPVIATDNGMRPRGVRLIPIGDSAALVAAIRQALSSPVSRAAVIESGRENLQAVLDLYAELVPRR
jgi:glycosyltransferase involved in cell wall biosynthesis